MELTNSDLNQIKSLMETGANERLFSDIKQELALSIVGTSLMDNKSREDLYMLSKTLDVVKAKLEEYVITYNNEQEA